MLDYADLHKSRLIHCHKIQKTFHIYEDYELTDGDPILARSTCPMCMDTANRKAPCNGLNEWDHPCSYAHTRNQ